MENKKRTICYNRLKSTISILKLIILGLTIQQLIALYEYTQILFLL